MAQLDLPPIPHKAQVLDQNGFLTPMWTDWFKKLFHRVGGNFASTNTELETVTTARIANDAVSFIKLLATDWTASKATSGYQKLGSGVILQWGDTGSLTSGSSTTITFPVEFPSACRQVLVGIKDNSGVATSATGQAGTGAYSTTGFSLYNRTSVAHTFNWIAIGH